MLSYELRLTGDSSPDSSQILLFGGQVKDKLCVGPMFGLQHTTSLLVDYNMQPLLYEAAVFKVNDQ